MKTDNTRKARRAAARARERAKRRKKFDRFILLVESGVRTRTALRQTGLSWRDDVAKYFSPVPLYAKRIIDAQREGHEWRRMILEDELFERGVMGVPEDVVSGGKIVATRIRYSDSCLIALARRYLPHLFIHKVAVDADEGRTIRDLIRELDRAGATSRPTRGS